VEKLTQTIKEMYAEKEESLGKDLFLEVTKVVLLNNLDHLWREHLHILDRLREGIYLRGYASKDPLVEYKKEAFYLFENMMLNFKERAIFDLMKVEIRSQEELEQEIQREEQQMESLLKQAVFSGVEGKSDQKGPRRKTLKERLQSRRKR
ncbi:MAG: preprotein translocase subunit SecA, partial [Hydrogenobacter thermophilus]|nr:preprotein translocase subunit SecA [Hydrogenobacter thermophilus]